MKSVVETKIASPSPFYATIRSSFKHFVGPQAWKIKAESCKDEGRPINNIKANLGVLRERIEQIKMKEKLERCFSRKHGWNYAPGYNCKLKRESEISQLFELVSCVAATLGFTFFSATLFLCLSSLFVHLIHGF